MENEALLQKRALSGFALKWIAVLSMVVDHFGSIVMDGVVAPYMNNGFLYFTADMPFMVYHSMLIKNVCDALGSAAFPIFCFLIAEGFTHTSDRIKYGVRMGVFALISEIPYNLAHYQTFFDPALQNVMFTLCAGIFTLCAIRTVEKRFAEKRGARIALTAAATGAGMALAFAVRGEYVFLGVLTIVLLYLLRDRGRLRLAGIAPLLVASPWILLAAVPLWFYGGARGRGSKYFFYVFYPAHFLVFALIAYLLSVRPI